MPAVAVKDLTFAYADGKNVLQSISFSVSVGEVFVIAGLSGCGKTTLCQLLSGVIPHAVKGRLSGEISVMGSNPAEIGLPQTAARVGLVFQDADSQLICTTVEDELAFGLENLCFPPEEIRRRVDELLTDFGLTELRHTSPARLSGGQKKLVCIAAVLALAPPVLILDEPLSSLDAEGRALVCVSIEEQRRQGRTVIMVEHDLSLVDFADRWLLLHNGGIAACDTPLCIIQQTDLLKELCLLP